MCLVTFNYDTLIEDTLLSVDIKIQNIADYISHRDYKLVKLHGSINWGRKVKVPALAPDKNAWVIVSELTEAGSMLQLTEEVFLADGQPIAGQTGAVLFPALAIPVETKKSYECPKAHLDCLCDLLPKVTKVLIIGWRGAEEHFLEMLREQLSKEVWLMVVAESMEATTEIVNRIKVAGVPGRFSVASNGFTGFIVNREGEQFLKEEIRGC